METLCQYRISSICDIALVASFERPPLSETSVECRITSQLICRFSVEMSAISQSR